MVIIVREFLEPSSPKMYFFYCVFPHTFLQSVTPIITCTMGMRERERQERDRNKTKELERERELEEDLP